MITAKGLTDMIAARGQRHVVYGTIRKGEYDVQYAADAEDTEELAAALTADRRRQVQIVAPEPVEDHADLLRTLGRERQAARRAEQEARDRLAAAICTAVEAGMSELQASMLAQIDRMTVRKILGK